MGQAGRDGERGDEAFNCGRRWGGEECRGCVVRALPFTLPNFQANT